MSKQSFVTGQVLTAQQVNDLQTNDFNQTVSAKTASYTLVAADKGTRITMSSTSATTITVNTGLFEAGDTLFIQNLNTGVSTITAGTATVNTSASLALAQHEGGTLYFTSAGVSTFFKAAGAAPAAGGGMTLISTTSLTGASVTLSSIPQTYVDLRIYIKNFKPASGSNINCRVNGLSTSIYRGNQEYSEAGADNRGATNTSWEIHARNQNSTTAEGLADYVIPDYTNATTWKYVSGRMISNNPTTATNYNFATFFAPVRQIAAITQLEFFPASGNFTSGTILLYGVK
jgi:hypothetical protein